jgi:hypothetical protein
VVRDVVGTHADPCDVCVIAGVSGNERSLASEREGRLSGIECHFLAAAHRDVIDETVLEKSRGPRDDVTHLTRLVESGRARRDRDQGR